MPFFGGILVRGLGNPSSTDELSLPKNGFKLVVTASPPRRRDMAIGRAVRR